MHDRSIDSVGLFPESKIPWLLDMLKNDIFGGADSISKNHFYQVSNITRSP